MSSPEVIAKEIRTFMQKHGGQPKEWFVGVSDNPKRDLEKRHNFDTATGDVGVIRVAETELQAVQVLNYFITKLGSKGTRDETYKNALQVYAYRLSGHTKP